MTDNPKLPPVPAPPATSSAAAKLPQIPPAAVPAGANLPPIPAPPSATTRLPPLPNAAPADAGLPPLAQLKSTAPQQPTVRLSIIVIALAILLLMGVGAYFSWQERQAVVTQNNPAPQQAVASQPTTKEQHRDGSTSTSTAAVNPDEEEPAEYGSWRAMTVGGDLVIKKAAEDDNYNSAFLNGKAVFGDESTASLTIQKTFNIGGKTVILLSYNSGGVSCPTDYVFLSIQKNGAVTKSDSFGTCSDLVTVSLQQDAVAVALPDIRGLGDEVWEYKNDNLAKVRSIDPNIEKNALKVSWVDDTQPVTLRGEIASRPTADGYKSEKILKLERGTILENCARFPLLKEIPLAADISIPMVSGMNDFEVIFFCGDSEYGISSISSAQTTLATGIYTSLPLKTSTLYIDTMLKAMREGHEQQYLQAAKDIQALQKPARGDKQHARQLNDEALTFLKSENWTSAMNSLMRAAEVDPMDREIAGNLAYSYDKLGRLNESITANMASLTIEPTQATSWGGLGVALAKSDKQTDAVAAFRLAYHFSNYPEKTAAYFQNLAVKDPSEKVQSAAAAALPFMELGQRNLQEEKTP